MIPLKFLRKSKVEKESAVHSYYVKVIEGAIKIDELNDWCLRHLKHKSVPCTFKDIVTFSYEDLKSILGQIRAAPLREDLITYMNTLYNTHVPRMEFIDILGETVCPYCNRAYINRSRNHTVCQLDHFFNRKDYPILAVSFYNLIPCCSTCNLIKKNNGMAYSPFDRAFQTADDLLEFDYLAEDYAEMTGRKPPSEILLKPANTMMQTNIDTLQLEELYQAHTDIVQELVIKKAAYPKEYLGFLEATCNGLDVPFERILTGSYTAAEDYGKRPLSKMKSDIGRKLGLF